MECKCKEWVENIEKVNAPLLLASARSGGEIQYDGKRFVFCPWCSSRLIDDELLRPQPDARIEKALLDYDEGRALNLITIASTTATLLTKPN